MICISWSKVKKVYFIHEWKSEVGSEKSVEKADVIQFHQWEDVIIHISYLKVPLLKYIFY